MITTEAMPSLDVSAALQAAVAAAAEIARVGMSDDLTAAFATPANAPAMTAIAPAPPREHERTPPTIQPQLVPVAPTPTTTATTVVDQVPVAPTPTATPAVVAQEQPQQQQQQQEQPIRSVDFSSFADQCTGQDAAGDHQNNDTASVSNGSVDVDAAGERTFEESEEDAAKRLARSRERNREHARRTRLRKKAQLEALQSKVRNLEAEKKSLKQKIEECSIASILINLAEPSPEEQQQQKDETTSLLDATIQRQENQQVSDARISLLTAGKRKRFASVDTSEEHKAPQTLKLQIDGQTTIIGPKSHINWKSGVYSDENGVQRQLTAEQLESLRRERNRMHAKMTRDRKKNFIATIEKTIDQLERDCQKMRDVLDKVGAHKQVLTAPVTPLMTPRQEGAAIKAEEMPSITVNAPMPAPEPVPAPSAPPKPTPSLLLPSLAMAVASAQVPIVKTNGESPPKRPKVAHGFSWNG